MQRVSVLFGSLVGDVFGQNMRNFLSDCVIQSHHSKQKPGVGFSFSFVLSFKLVCVCVSSSSLSQMQEVLVQGGVCVERLVQPVGVYRSRFLTGLLWDWMPEGSLHSLLYEVRSYFNRLAHVCVCSKIILIHEDVFSSTDDIYMQAKKGSSYLQTHLSPVFI